MTSQKRTVWEEIARGLRGLVDDLGRLMNPQPPKPVRVPVPVPVRPPVRQPRRSHQDDLYR